MGKSYGLATASGLRTIFEDDFNRANSGLTGAPVLNNDWVVTQITDSSLGTVPTNQFGVISNAWGVQQNVSGSEGSGATINRQYVFGRTLEQYGSSGYTYKISFDFLGTQANSGENKHTWAMDLRVLSDDSTAKDKGTGVLINYIDGYGTYSTTQKVEIMNDGVSVADKAFAPADGTRLYAWIYLEPSRIYYKISTSSTEPPLDLNNAWHNAASVSPTTRGKYLAFTWCARCGLSGTGTATALDVELDNFKVEQRL